MAVSLAPTVLGISIGSHGKGTPVVASNYGSVPSKDELRRLLDQGMTHQAIADYVYETTGERVGRVAVSSAVSRHALNATPRRPRYDRYIPWRVVGKHQKRYAARMLRLYSRRELGQRLPEVDARKLDSWLATMDADGVVVTYRPQLAEGFVYVDRTKVQTDGPIAVPSWQQK